MPDARCQKCQKQYGSFKLTTHEFARKFTKKTGQNGEISNMQLGCRMPDARNARNSMEASS
jgi:hypothetical protein